MIFEVKYEDAFLHGTIKKLWMRTDNALLIRRKGEVLSHVYSIPVQIDCFAITLSSILIFINKILEKLRNIIMPCGILEILLCHVVYLFLFRKCCLYEHVT